MFRMKPKKPLEEVVRRLRERAQRQDSNYSGNFNSVHEQHGEKQASSLRLQLCNTTMQSASHQDNSAVRNVERSHDLEGTSRDGVDSDHRKRLMAGGKVLLDDKSVLPSNEEQTGDNLLLEDCGDKECMDSDFSAVDKVVVLSHEDDESLSLPASKVEKHVSEGTVENKVSFAVESDQYVVDCDTDANNPEIVEEEVTDANDPEIVEEDFPIQDEKQRDDDIQESADDCNDSVMDRNSQSVEEEEDFPTQDEKQSDGDIKGSAGDCNHSVMDRNSQSDLQETNVKLIPGCKFLVLKLEKVNTANVKAEEEGRQHTDESLCKDGNVSDRQEMSGVVDENQTCHEGVERLEKEQQDSVSGKETNAVNRKKKKRLRPPKSSTSSHHSREVLVSGSSYVNCRDDVFENHLPSLDVRGESSSSEVMECKSVPPDSVIQPASSVGSSPSGAVKNHGCVPRKGKDESSHSNSKQSEGKDKIETKTDQIKSPSARLLELSKRNETATKNVGRSARTNEGASPGRQGPKKKLFEGRNRSQDEGALDPLKKSKMTEKRTDRDESDSDDVEIITQDVAVPDKRKTESKTDTQRQEAASACGSSKGVVKKQSSVKRKKDQTDSQSHNSVVKRRNRNEQSENQVKRTVVKGTARKSVSSTESLATSAEKMKPKPVVVIDSNDSGDSNESESSSSSTESSWNTDSDIKKRLFGNEQQRDRGVLFQTRSRTQKSGNHEFLSVEVPDSVLLSKKRQRRYKLKHRQGVASGRRTSSARTVVTISSGSDEGNNSETKIEEQEERDVAEHKSKKRKIVTKNDQTRGSSVSSKSVDTALSSSESPTSSNMNDSEDDGSVVSAGHSSLDDFNLKLKPTRRSKRRLSLSSSSKSSSSLDGSSNAHTSDSDETQTRLNRNKKKRKKRAVSSSEDSGDEEDDEDEGTSPSKSSGRRNLRKIIGDEKLSKETKAAQAEEQKRLERLKKRTSDRMHWTPSKTDEKEKHIVLETVAGNSSQVLVEVSDYLTPHLKEHQVNGIRFMWDCVFESIDEASKNGGGSGCILAHCMGLGKTLQVVTIIDILMRHRDLFDLSKILIMAPKNAVSVWVDELNRWIPDEDLPQIWYLHGVNSNNIRLDIVSDWHMSGGVLIIGYEMYRNLSQGTRIRRREWRDEFFRTLQDPGPDVVVCDEGHVLRNWDSALAKAVNKIKTKRRIVLTGTPLQNNLNEYYTMVNFVKPNFLGTHREFTNRFANPISNGQHSDSTPTDVRLMKQRAHVLHELLTSAVQRRDYSVLLSYLPPKYEYVIFVRLNDLQIKLYRLYLEKCVDGGGLRTSGLGQRGAVGVFQSYHQLMRVWTHPYLLRVKEEELLDKLEKIEERHFVATDEETSESEPEKNREPEKSNGGRDSGDEEVILLGQTIAEGSKGHSSRKGSPIEEGVVNSWFGDLVKDEHELDLELSAKFFILMEVVRGAEAVGDKVLVFSQSLLTLNLLESLIQEEEFGGFCLGIDYYRLDGSSAAESRRTWAENFNRKKNKRLRLFLISTRAGSLGVNLVGANRVVIMDASWNPTHDTQSLFRVYRFGQEKPVYIYRFIAQGTMEERVYDRQVTKQSLSRRVVDERQIERHFTLSDLQELYKFDPNELTDDSKPPVDQKEPQDPLLSYLLLHFQPRWIIRYHEHSSLLEDQVDERLTDEEKKVAWEQYELEKKGLRVGPPDEANGTANASFAQLQRDADRMLQIQQIAAAGLRSSVYQPSPAVHQPIANVEELESQLLRQERENPSVLAYNMMMLRRKYPRVYMMIVAKYHRFAIPPALQSLSLVSSSHPAGLVGGLSMPPAVVYTAAAGRTAGEQAPRVPSVGVRLLQPQLLPRLPDASMIPHPPK